LYEHTDVEVPESCSCFTKCCKVLVFTMTLELLVLGVVAVVLLSVFELAEDGPYTEAVPAQFEDPEEDYELVKTERPHCHTEGPGECGGERFLSIYVYILITVGVLGFVVLGAWLCWTYAGQILHCAGLFLHYGGKLFHLAGQLPHFAGELLCMAWVLCRGRREGYEEIPGLGA